MIIITLGFGGNSHVVSGDLEQLSLKELMHLEQQMHEKLARVRAKKVKCTNLIFWNTFSFFFHVFSYPGILLTICTYIDIYVYVYTIQMLSNGVLLLIRTS